MADSTTRNEPPREDPSDLVGTKVGRYSVESLIGRGGMGEVYKATDPLLKRKVALKRITRKQEGGAEEKRRVLREARRSSKISDPRIAAVYDVLEMEDEVILVMEHIEGRTLRAVIAERPSIDEFWPIAEECTQALAVAHREGVLHRDIKPENIMITKSGGVKVLDFGLAKPLSGDRAADTLTTETFQETKLAGTPQYMAPESLLGRETDARADVFALGVTFYELLTGARPFQGATYYAVTHEILNTEPSPPTESNTEIPDSLSAVVLRMLSKDPVDRYATAEEVLTDLRSARGGEQVLPLRPRKKPKNSAPKPWAKAVPAIAALAVVVLFLVLGGLERVRERFGWYPLPSQKNVVLLPIATEEGEDEELAVMALGMSSLLGSGLVGLSTDPSLQTPPFMDVIRMGVDKPSEAREMQGANLVVQSEMRGDHQRLRATMRLLDPVSGRQLRSRTIAASRSRPHDFLRSAFAALVEMLDFPSDGLEQSGHVIYRSEGEGTLRAYLGGLGRVIEVGPDALSPADTTRIREAVASFELATRLDPDHAPSLAGLARAYRQMYKATRDTTWLDRGETAARKAITLDNKFADAYKRLSFILWDKGRNDLAIEEMRKALAFDPLDYVAAANLGAYYRVSGLREEEERLYLQLAEARPHHWYPHWWLARAYYRQGRLRETREALEQVIRLAPDLYKGYQFLGALYVLDGNYEEAARNLEISISIYPTDEALSNLGVAYFNMRDFDRCIQTFNDAFDYAFADYEDWLNLGDAYYWAPGERDKAARAYDYAVRLGRESLSSDPSNSMIRANLAQIYPKVGRPDSAKVYIEEAITGDPDNPMVQYCAAVTYWQLDERDKALEWLGRSVAGGYPVSWLRDSPMFDEWRSEDRFQEIVRESRDGD